MTTNTCDCSVMYKRVFRDHSVWAWSIVVDNYNKNVTEKPQCFDFPTSTEVALLGMNNFFCETNFAIIGACIDYLWTEYCIYTMYILIYLYNINTFHHTIFYDCQSYFTIEKNCVRTHQLGSCLQFFAICVPVNPADLIIYQSSLYPRMWMST